MEDLLIRAGCFVAIIILGFVLRRVGFFKENAFEVLSKVVVKITLPAAVVKNLSTCSVDAALLSISALAVLSGVLYMAVAYLTHLKKNRNQKAFAVLNLPGFNIGVFALPFVSSFLGASGVLAASLFDLGNSIICLGGSYGIASCIKAGKGFSLKRIGKALLTSVPFLTYVVMLIVMSFKLTLPGPVLQLADIISSGNAFCAMLMIGVGFKLEANRHQLGQVAKMIGLRFGIGLALAAVFYFLLPFDADARLALALLAVSPVGSAVPGFTRELGEDTGLSCTIGSVSIICSIVLMVSMLMLTL